MYNITLLLLFLRGAVTENCGYYDLDDDEALMLDE